MAKILRFPARKRRSPKRGTTEGQASLFEGFSYAPEADLHLRGSDAHPVSMPSDAEPANRLDLPGEPPPELVRQRTFRRRTFATALGAVFLLGIAAAVFGERGWLDVQRRQADLERVRAEAAKQEARVNALRSEVSHLRTDRTSVERIAREDLGYALPGEVTLVLPVPREVDPRAGSATVRGSEK